MTQPHSQHERAALHRHRGTAMSSAADVTPMGSASDLLPGNRRTDTHSTHGNTGADGVRDTGDNGVSGVVGGAGMSIGRSARPALAATRSKPTTAYVTDVSGQTAQHLRTIQQKRRNFVGSINDHRPLNVNNSLAINSYATASGPTVHTQQRHAHRQQSTVTSGNSRLSQPQIRPRVRASDSQTARHVPSSSSLAMSAHAVHNHGTAGGAIRVPSSALAAASASAAAASVHGSRVTANATVPLISQKQQRHASMADGTFSMADGRAPSCTPNVTPIATANTAGLSSTAVNVRNSDAMATPPREPRGLTSAAPNNAVSRHAASHLGEDATSPLTELSPIGGVSGLLRSLRRGGRQSASSTSNGNNSSSSPQRQTTAVASSTSTTGVGSFVKRVAGVLFGGGGSVTREPPLHGTHRVPRHDPRRHGHGSAQNSNNVHNLENAAYDAELMADVAAQLLTQDGRNRLEALRERANDTSGEPLSDMDADELALLVAADDGLHATAMIPQVHNSSGYGDTRSMAITQGLGASRQGGRTGNGSFVVGTPVMDAASIPYHSQPFDGRHHGVQQPHGVQQRVSEDEALAYALSMSVSDQNASADVAANDEDDVLGGAANNDEEQIQLALAMSMGAESESENGHQRTDDDMERVLQMSLEESQALSQPESGSDGRPAGLPTEQMISRLPVIVFLKSYAATGNKEDSECSICLADYEEGDLVTRLPCLHGYHQACIGDWLGKSSVCPICKTSIDATSSFDA